jgi:competence protein ComGC
MEMQMIQTVIIFLYFIIIYAVKLHKKKFNPNAKKATEKMIKQYIEEVELALQSTEFYLGCVTFAPTVQVTLQPLVEEYKEVTHKKVNS